MVIKASSGTPTIAINVDFSFFLNRQSFPVLVAHTRLYGHAYIIPLVLYFNTLIFYEKLTQAQYTYVSIPRIRKQPRRLQHKYARHNYTI
ncbi:hypothetical protein CR970_04180 [Candidatus Saccharibacteria bacterium]|nr:MAG: hypothetical protein CR970_04180 [Candidatus Saccharibacteria bacterium]